MAKRFEMMPQHPNEPDSNLLRASIAEIEPVGQRTFTPSLAVIAKSLGVFHWTTEGRRLYDFTSGVLVANLGHNPPQWMERWRRSMGWSGAAPLPINAYNAVTPIEVEAGRRTIPLLRGAPGGERIEQMLWAASGSEAIQKALWACLAFDRSRDIILATRHGFHGKKGLANAVTGSEADPDRDPRVQFVSFPMAECRDISQRDEPFDPASYQRELDDLAKRFLNRIAALITEPYLGGAGSYHPPAAYLQLLQNFCRERGILFVLDEVQSNFGRTGPMFAFESYGLAPDLVVLGKSLANGVPVAAVVGRRDVLGSLGYGEGSDTWSGNPLACAAVVATLDEFENPEILANLRKVSPVIESGLVRLKDLPFVAFVRGERGGMVWGVETRDHAGLTAADWANRIVEACYRGEGGDGIHLLGPLAKKVIRIAPPLTITVAEATDALALMNRIAIQLNLAIKASF